MGSTSSGGLPISDLGFQLLAGAPGFGSTSSGPRGRVHELGPATDFGSDFNTPVEKLYGILTAKLFRESKLRFYGEPVLARNGKRVYFRTAA